MPVTRPGSFAYYITSAAVPSLETLEGDHDHEQQAERKQTETHYIDVAPTLEVKSQILPINALSIFSVLSKFVGRYPEAWNGHLHGIAQRGYNMVHFAPLMTRGESNSPYSIYDQLQFDPEVFPNGERDIAGLVESMQTEHGLLSLTDVVWNHTASDSKWLQSHPEAGYNVQTAPWLEAALELDTALLQFGTELAGLGLSTDIQSLEELQAIIDAIKEHVFSRIKLSEFYGLDVAGDIQRVLDAWKNQNHRQTEHDQSLQGYPSWTADERVTFLLNKSIPTASQIRGRYARAIDPQVGAAALGAQFGPYAEDKLPAAEEHLTTLLNDTNLVFFREYDDDVAAILDQLHGRIKYLRLDDHGPKLGAITESSPLVEPYFTRLPLNETTQSHDPKSLCLANNGWIWNADAMRDHAGPDSKAYLRREVIVWGDCVKLRYGRCPEDSPFLWSFMAQYTRLMARYFSGFRLDNCHSTPLVVAEYLLAQARAVQPNLVVFAELFTGSEEADYVFVKRLGINALIREAMQAWSTEELSRLVHRHAGRPIGSFDTDAALHAASQSGKKESMSHLRPTPVQALFMDCTHDNETPAQKRDARDTLPNAALVALGASASGSVMGYDEVYPQLVDLVHETRLYSSAFSEGEVAVGGGEGGIGGVKRLLNDLHTKMGIDGYDESYIHHDGEYITIHRVHPRTRKGVFLIAHTAFPGCNDGRILPPTHLVGTQVKHIGTYVLEVDADEETRARVLADKEYLRGLPSRVREFTGTSVQEENGDSTISVLESFVPGSIALFDTWIPGSEHADGLDNFITQGATDAFADLSLVDLNFVLYRCDAEEQDSSGGRDGVYNVPGYGPLVYAGLQGWWSVLEPIVRENNMGHALCDHLRDGQWALDYTVNRLDRAAHEEGYTALQKPAQWLRERFDAVRSLPSFLLPRYFAIIVQVAYSAAWKRAIAQLDSPTVQNGNDFVHRLAMVSVQQTGYVQSASLWPSRRVACLAAGLPHFATSWARCWGRDVFISLRGLFLCTGRYDDAKEHILAFASVLKHGMIPNLLNSGTAPRYNSRDSVWFLLQAIQDYTVMVPDGHTLLDESVQRRYLPYDDTWFAHDDPRAYSQSSTVRDIVHEVLQRHASGLSFREYNAGPDLDVQMKPEGFDINVWVDWDTGFVMGGSRFNCGTWMDKMGESEKAGNKGVPGTPRDGASIEITGLVYSALSWLASLHPDGSVQLSDTGSSSGSISYADWAGRIRSNFERCFYVPLDPTEDSSFDVDASLVHRRGIYKDLYRSSTPYEDYQLRANFPIAATVAPPLFSRRRVQHALVVADDAICGPLGMATLDPKDWNYRPTYDNSNDSDDFATARGRNYHQGPEWVWLRGYFLRALLKSFSGSSSGPSTGVAAAAVSHAVSRRLDGCKRAIQTSPWRGLTELTNQNGQECSDSVRIPFLVPRLFYTIWP